MHISLISPNIVSQKGDVAGTGIPYIPISLVYLATYLKSKGYHVQLIDSFSENPFNVVEKNGFLYQGLTAEEVTSRIDEKSELVILYAGQVYAHSSLLDIFDKMKELGKEVVIVENTQAVTAYSLQHAYKDFTDHGLNYVLSGEAEPRIESFIEMINGKKSPKDIDGLIYRDKVTGKIIINQKKIFQDPNKLPFPDWDMINLKNYWKLGYAHAPLTTGKYLPLLTSRGCPLMCKFCVVPSTNMKTWRPRNPKNVVDEIEIYSKKYHVKEFHIEDLNPTVDRKRIVDICRLLIERNIKVMIKFAAGTKAETFDLDTLDWMAKAGFNYISISPESGSMHVLRLMKKYFNHKEALEQVSKMHDLGITSQACIVLGFPGETKNDLIMTKRYVNKLARAGLDEVALFIMTPVPGSDVYEKYSHLHKDVKISTLTFTPKWRKEYKNLVRWRISILIGYLINRAIFHPLKTVQSVFHVFTKHFRTKMEMTLYRLLKTHYIFRRARNQ